MSKKQKQLHTAATPIYACIMPCSDFSVHAAASIHIEWPFVEFQRPRNTAEKELFKAATLQCVVLKPRPRSQFKVYLPTLQFAREWCLQRYGDDCLEVCRVFPLHLPPAVVRRFPKPLEGAEFSASTGALLSPARRGRKRKR